MPAPTRPAYSGSWPEPPPEISATLPVEQRGEGGVFGRQHEGEAEALDLSRAARLLRRAGLGDGPQHALHRVDIDAGATVEHAVDRRGADAGNACDLGDGGRGRHRIRFGLMPSRISSKDQIRQRFTALPVDS